MTDPMSTSSPKVVRWSHNSWYHNLIKDLSFSIIICQHAKMFSFPLPQGNNMSPHFFHSAVDHVSMSVLGSPVLIYIDDCCGHKIDAAAFDVIEELLAALFKSCKFCGHKIVDSAFDMIKELLLGVGARLNPSEDFLVVMNACCVRKMFKTRAQLPLVSVWKLVSEFAGLSASIKTQDVEINMGLIEWKMHGYFCRRTTKLTVWI